MKNALQYVAVGAVLLVAVGAYFFPKASVLVGTTAQGSTSSTARQYSVYGVNLAAPGSNATSTSILNNSGQDLFITAEKAVCTGVGTSKTAYTGTGLASLTVTIATSSTANPAVNSNTNTLPVITIATSTGQFAISSSTVGTPGNGLVSNIWKNNTYLSFFTNATNTAVCTLGVDVTST